MMALGTVIAAIHILFGSATSFHFGATDLFKLLDPDAYRALTWADLPRLLIKLFGTSLFMWVYFAISIKRLHDRDKSGWWMVPFFAAPGLYSQFADRLPDSTADLPLTIAASGHLFCGASSRCIASRARARPTGSAPTR